MRGEPITGEASIEVLPFKKVIKTMKMVEYGTANIGRHVKE